MEKSKLILIITIFIMSLFFYDSHAQSVIGVSFPFSNIYYESSYLINKKPYVIHFEIGPGYYPSMYNSNNKIEHTFAPNLSIETYKFFKLNENLKTFNNGVKYGLVFYQNLQHFVRDKNGLPININFPFAKYLGTSIGFKRIFFKKAFCSFDSILLFGQARTGSYIATPFLYMKINFGFEFLVNNKNLFSIK